MKDGIRGDLAGLKEFTLQDQLQFARLSGDANPIHVDPIAARRFMFGEPVVHGAHLVLWALDRLLALCPGSYRLRRLKVVFRQPAWLDQPIRVVVRHGANEADGQVKLDIEGADGAALARISLEWQRDGHYEPDQPDMMPVRRSDPAIAGDVDLSGELLLGYEGALARAMFPRCSASLPWRQIATLLASSYVVGMEAPGLHSLFADLDLAFDDNGDDSVLSYRVTRNDERFMLLTISFAGAGARGNARAFIRPPPIVQPAMKLLTPSIDNSEFTGQRALIIGASRGIGEVAAKLLLGGGAQVFLTYRRGAQDMDLLLDDIAGEGYSASASRFDCLAITPDDVARIRLWKPTHLYFFASPFIKAGTVDRFSATLFDAFAAVYVKGFADTITAFSDTLEAVFCPSSVHVTHPPANLREYACAKAAAEALCLNRFTPSGRPLDYLAPRLPVLATDQTVRVEGAALHEIASVLLFALRDFVASK